MSTKFTAEQDKAVAQLYKSEEAKLAPIRSALLTDLIGWQEEDATVLDLGCGIGATPVLACEVLHLLKSGAQVTCVDHSPAMLQHARDANKSNGAKIVDLDLTADSIAQLAEHDIVVLQAMIHWFRNAQQILVAALKRTKMRLYVSTTLETADKEGIEMKAGSVPYWRRRMTKATFLTLVQNSITEAGSQFTFVYYERNDPYGKVWMNVVATKKGMPAAPIGTIAASLQQH